MTKIIAINGSPRRNWNTAKLLQAALDGAASCGAETKLVHLYSLNYKGCISCFACKNKSLEHGHCAMKDDLSPFLEEIRTCDAILFGSPIYYMNLSSGMLAFLERLFFSNYIYSNEIRTVFPKKIPSAFFCTMNMTEREFTHYRMKRVLYIYESSAERHLQVPPKMLYAYNTVQFSDYNKYESSIFDPEEKYANEKENFPGLLKQAYEIGKELMDGEIPE